MMYPWCWNRNSQNSKFLKLAESNASRNLHTFYKASMIKILIKIYVSVLSKVLKFVGKQLPPKGRWRVTHPHTVRNYRMRTMPGAPQTGVFESEVGQSNGVLFCFKQSKTSLYRCPCRCPILAFVFSVSRPHPDLDVEVSSPCSRSSVLIYGRVGYVLPTPRG